MKDTWHLSPTHLGQAYDIGAADGANIALVYGPKDGGPENFLSNARKIVAAPRMHAQLTSTLHTLCLMADAYPVGSATRNTLEEECDAIRAALP